MPPPELPLELLLMIAYHIRDEDGELRYDDFNSFLQVNSVLYTCLNRKLWEEASEDDVGTQHILTYLIETKNLAGVEFFLEIGADVEVGLPAFEILEPDNETEWVVEPTALLVAADLDDVPLARLLIEKGAAKVQYRGEFSPMHAARSAEMVQLLLDHNADPEFHDNFGLTPLYWYAIREDVSTMRAVLQHGVDMAQKGLWWRPLHTAALRNLDIVKLFVEHGAVMKLSDFQGNTPLHLAAEAGKTDVVKFLVERWPEGIRATNRYCETPLHLAAEVGNTDVVRFLVECWPEGKKALNIYGKTPLSKVEKGSWRRRKRLSDEEKKEMIALLL
jgi:hypothetical protein